MKRYAMDVVYPISEIHSARDHAIETAAGQTAWASGGGGKERDLAFEYDSEEDRDAARDAVEKLPFRELEVSTHDRTDEEME